MVGSPADASVYQSWDLMRLKLDQVVGQFTQDPNRSKQYFHYEGKPFILDYVGTPSPFQNGLPPWHDDRFTVRHLTGFVSDQANLRNGDFSKYGYWSWEDRALQTRTQEVMTVSAGWRGEPCGWNCANNRRGRENGATYR